MADGGVVAAGGGAYSCAFFGMVAVVGQVLQGKGGYVSFFNITISFQVLASWVSPLWLEAWSTEYSDEYSVPPAPA